MDQENVWETAVKGSLEMEIIKRQEEGRLEGEIYGDQFTEEITLKKERKKKKKQERKEKNNRVRELKAERKE